MKIKILFFFALLANLLSAQESNDKTIYLDSLRKEIPQGNHKYYKVIKDYTADKSEYTVLEYFKSGKLSNEGIYKDKEAKIRNGETTFYYENGTKRSKTFYADNNPYGKSTYWYENGALKEEGEYTDPNNKNGRSYKTINFWNSKGEQTVSDGNGNYESGDEYYIEKGMLKKGEKDGVWTGTSKKSSSSYTEKYDNGKFIHGESTDEKGVKNEYDVFEKRPEPKKGLQHFYEYVGKKFKYTKEALRNKIQGKILLTFVVEKDGQLVDIKILKGLGYGLDEEAIKAVSSYDNWIPGEQRGRKVRCLFSLPLTVKPE